VSLQDKHVLIIAQVLIKRCNSEYRELYFCVVVVIEPISIKQRQPPQNWNVIQVSEAEIKFPQSVVHEALKCLCGVA
jgi:hypothetical protein